MMATGIAVRAVYGLSKAKCVPNAPGDRRKSCESQVHDWLCIWYENNVAECHMIRRQDARGLAGQAPTFGPA